MGYLIMSLLLGGTLGVGLFLLIPRNTKPATRVDSGLLPNASMKKKSHLARSFNDSLERYSRVFHIPAMLFLIGSITLGLLSGLTVFTMTAVPSFSFAAGGFMLWLPTITARAKLKGEHRRVMHQWSDVVDALVASIRSNATIPQAIGGLSASKNRFIALGARGFLVDYESTGNFSKSVARLKQHWQDPYADRIIETLRMARELGSPETSAVLVTLGSHIRQDVVLRQEIDARQGWVRLAARVGVAAPWLVLIILSGQPSSLEAFRTPAGSLVILAGVFASWGAYRLMLRIGSFRSELRWLA